MKRIVLLLVIALGLALTGCNTVTPNDTTSTLPSLASPVNIASYGGGYTIPTATGTTVTFTTAATITPQGNAPVAVGQGASYTLSSAGIYQACTANGGTPACASIPVFDPSTGFVTGGGWFDSPTNAITTEFFNGFETDTTGWSAYNGSNVNRVPSGTDGITAASGGYFAEVTQGSPSSSSYPGAYTQWGGYHASFPSGGYYTSIDIYLDVNGGYADDTRFDWDSSISDTSGGFRRDFIFNAGFYDSRDTTGPGAGTNRFVISASNNSSPGSAYPKDPGRDPIAITTSGWYTFQHHFYETSGGVLAVDLSIHDASGNLVHTWTLSDPTDIIGSTVGGNHYGWFDDMAFPYLAIDNTARNQALDVTGKASFGFVAKYTKHRPMPVGSIQFQVPAANIKFHSTRFDSLQVNGSDSKAQITGTGIVNGRGSYDFTLWATEGAPGSFRIRISNGNGVLYDTAIQAPLGGGAIVVH
ncbi:MAG: hypothetical protein P8Y05_01555 [Deinococcales bacterium]